MRLLTLNTYGTVYFEDKIIPFLTQHKDDWDVVCLQEVFQGSIKKISASLDMPYHEFSFLSQNPFDMASWDFGNGMDDVGTAIFSRTPIRNAKNTYYFKGQEEKPIFKKTTFEENQKLNWHGVLIGEVELGNVHYKIATTHFLISKERMSDPVQEKVAQDLVDILKKEGDIVFCGDLNVARSVNDCYPIFTDYFTDAIPQNITTTIDWRLHRAGEKLKDLECVVDYIFHTPGYTVSNMQFHSGISDHIGVSATITQL